MQKRRFPGIDLDISALGFGCMRLPLNSSNPADIDTETAKLMVRRAIDNGVNYIDTGWSYHSHQSEPFLAEALSGGYREKVHVATKLPSWEVHSRNDMDRLLDEQLNRLQTDSVDFYLLHALDASRWSNYLDHQVFDFLDSAKASGKVKHIGFSFHDTVDSFKTIIDSYPWEFCQIQYNFLDTDVQAGTEGLTYAYDAGIGIIVMEPLRGGSLTGKVPREVQRIYHAAPVSRTPAEWALRWVWNDPRITVVLSGMSTMEQVEENLKYADAALPNSLAPEELDVIEAVKDMYRSKIEIPCTECGYCMPCPYGVNIPKAFSLYNDACIFNEVEDNMRKYRQFLTGNEASLCTACGTCEPLCPQGIPIIESLKAPVKMFESNS